MQPPSRSGNCGASALCALAIASLFGLPSMAAESAPAEAPADPAQEEKPSGWLAMMTDPEDGRFDMSRWLLDRKGFLPIPLIITEPAVGYGGGLGLAFFHRNEGVGVDGKPIPPDISAVLGMGTENGTWAGGAAHMGFWRQNTIRTTSALIVPSINVDFYGGGNLPEIPGGIAYQLQGWVAVQSVLFRLRGGNWWAGAQAIYLNADTKLRENPPPPLDQLAGKVSNGSLGATLQYDSRDNLFSPTTGWSGELQLRQHWGEFRDRDFSYTALDADSKYYFRKGDDWYFGWRVKANFSGEDTPFYALPFISLRGIPMARYQGEQVLSTEVEARYAIDRRWSVLGFGGVGRAASADDKLSKATDRWSGGGGFRYLIARQLGFQTGIDVARGPEEWAFYLQFGSAWVMF